MSRINFTPFPFLATERLNLRQISLADMEEFYILKSDERLLKNYDAKPKTYEQAKEFLLRLNNDVLQNKCIVWGIALKEDDKLIGSICFWNLRPEKDEAEVGYELMQDFQGRGIMQEALKAVIRYGFYDMELKVIDADPNPAHIRSIKLLEKFNFARGENFTIKEPSGVNILERAYLYLKREDAEEFL